MGEATLAPLEAESMAPLPFTPGVKTATAQPTQGERDRRDDQADIDFGLMSFDHLQNRL
jgi:hypothetical protein